MTVSLYDATIPSFKQILDVVPGLLAKAEEFCNTKSIAPEKILQARLADDMWPFAAQVVAIAANSWGYIEGMLGSRMCRPNTSLPPSDFAGLNACINNAIVRLESVKPTEINALLGENIRFVIRDHHVDFTSEDFFFSFCLPNFYFHVTTAYDILRWQGLPLAKRDYIGKMRTKQ